MIEVIVKGTIKGRKHELARIKIISVHNQGTHADYSVQFAVDTAEGTALYQRAIYSFPRKRLNVLALLRLALETLEEKELSLDADPDASDSPNLARRLLPPL